MIELFMHSVTNNGIENLAFTESLLESLHILYNKIVKNSTNSSVGLDVTTILVIHVEFQFSIGFINKSSL